MPQVSTKTLEKLGYTDAKGACELLGWGYHGRNLQKLRKAGFSDIIQRGKKIGYNIKALEKFRIEVIDNPKSKIHIA